MRKYRKIGVRQCRKRISNTISNTINTIATVRHFNVLSLIISIKDYPKAEAQSKVFQNSGFFDPKPTA